MLTKEPYDFNMESTTIWSFPDHGNWATHSGKYRGNWSPYIPRNLILRYSQKSDLILDPFMGSGTTLIEAKLLGRNAIGIDVNTDSIALSKRKLDFDCEEHSKIKIVQGDARNLSFIQDRSVDFICTHPPYADIILYSQNLPNDISHLSYTSFLRAMNAVAKESFRVLKNKSICAFMIGDIRKKGYVLPLGMNTMQEFVNIGFRLKEIIIKEQHHCRSSKVWNKRNHNFLLLAHEYIFVLEKQ